MALEPINYTSRAREIEAEYLKIVKGTDETTTWLIIGPNELKEYGPEATGNNFSDFLQSFDDTKVQYGLARVSPPGSDVYKLILIGWCPESASMKSRASFSSNFAVVANNILRGYHVQVTARDEDDLNEQELLTKISNAAGARYSIQSEVKSKASSLTNVSPSVVKKKFSDSNYLGNSISANNKKEEEKKNIPISPSRVSATANTTTHNSVKDDNDDWDEPEIEERDLDKNPLKPNPSNYKPIGKVNLQDVISEEKNKQDPRIVKNVAIKSADNDSKINPIEDIANLKAQSKLQRDYEIDSFLKNPIFKQQHDDKVIKGFQNEKSPAQLWAERKAKGTETTTHESLSTSSPVSEVDSEKHEDIENLRSKFEQFNIESNNPEPKIIEPQRFVPPVAELQNTPNISSRDKPNLKVIGTPLPDMHDKEIANDTKPKNDDNDDDDGNDWSDEEENLPKSQPVPLPPRDISSTQEVETERQQQQESEQELAKDEKGIETNQEESEPEQAPSLPPRNIAPESNDDVAPPLPSRNMAPEPVEEDKEEVYVPPPPPRRNVAPEPEEEEVAPWAVAEYDYEAGEDNELTFEEGDKIINIDFVDDDWWLGELEKTGEKGLFPSNYVSLHDH